MYTPIFVISVLAGQIKAPFSTVRQNGHGYTF